jgi:hypothetical protein
MFASFRASSASVNCWVRGIEPRFHVASNFASFIFAVVAMSYEVTTYLTFCVMGTSSMSSLCCYDRAVEGTMAGPSYPHLHAANDRCSQDSCCGIEAAN